MKKSITWRVRALGRAGNYYFAADKSFDDTFRLDRPNEVEVHRQMFPALACALHDFEIARLETIVSGPNVLARHEYPYAVKTSPHTFESVDNSCAAYYRTIIDTREWITRAWADPASAARWEELSEKE
jgi:hypothetical protein